jgi:CDP-glycerol glycerophosphotransferase
LEGFVYNFSKYDDIAELYLISDLLITDYSSVFFDYANLKRPILFFTYDLEKYRDTLRGFYIDIETEVPGPLVKTTDEIIDAVTNIEQVKAQYQAIYDDFYNKYCGWDDGKAAEKVVKTVFGVEIK